MHDVLTDIRNKLQLGAYQNEEHVRLSLVSRLLLELGWTIWDPAEVNTEFSAIPAEDRTRVDVALFATKFSPSVFLEVKAVGKMAPNLTDVERQVRDYNRNNTALFSVITDGRMWRFYYSQTGGEFHNKCFKKCDLLEDDLEDLEETFSLFLNKESILNGRAKEHAGKYLQLTNEQKAVRDCLPQAKRLVQAPPYPSLPQAIVELVELKGFPLSESKAAELLDRMPESSAPTPMPRGPDAPPVEPRPTEVSKPEGSAESRIQSLDPENPGELHFSKARGSIGGKPGRNWNELVGIGVKLALQAGADVVDLNQLLPVNIRLGIHTSSGYRAIDDGTVSVQYVDTNNAARALVLLAKKCELPLELTVRWYGKSPRASEQGLIQWRP